MGRDYGGKDVKGRGLQIYTAIDLNAQDAASKILEGGLESLEKSSRFLRRRENPLEGAIIMVDVPAGEIPGLIGGRNYAQPPITHPRATRSQWAQTCTEPTVPAPH